MKFMESFPETVEIDGVDYRIDSDFRTSIRFEVFIQDAEDDEKIVLELLRLYYGEEIPPNITKAVEEALWFYSGGDVKKKSGTPSDTQRPQPYSFEHDWNYIYSAFLEQFGIDLQESSMHWWKFRALFQSLSDKTKFSEIICYRTVKLSQVPKEQRDFYRKMKKLYALPKSDKEEERMKDIRDRLRNGENIEEVFGGV